jgi:hypothetical protein
MSSLKFLVAAAAAATLSLGFAQGVPPKPAANPAVGAGQRSTEGTPMGTTGTPGGGGAMAQGTTSGSTAASTTASGSMTTMSTGTHASSTMNSAGGKHKQHAKRKHHHKMAKADRG